MKFSLAFLLVVGLVGTQVNGNPVPESYPLHDDLNDFLALIPKEKVYEIVLEYTQDEEIQRVMAYLKSVEFKELFTTIENMEYVQVLIKYLHESGLDVYRILNIIHQFLELETVNNDNILSTSRVTGGMTGLINDIKALLPIEDIKALYYHKMENSKAFKYFIERFQTEEFKVVMKSIGSHQEFQKIIKELKESGVDVAAFSDLLVRIFGIKLSVKNFLTTYGLHDDLNDFLALIPTEDVVKLFLEYLEKDEEVQFVIEYMQSAEFRELVKVVEEIEDVINFYNYIHESGLDIYGLVNKLHDLIGLPPLVPGTKSSIKITGGVAGFIADFKLLLPVEDIKALYYKKLEVSVEFKLLIERLKSPKFQAVVNALISNEEFQEILAKAKSFGVDVKAITDLLATIFGLEFPSPKYLRKQQKEYVNLDEFITLIPQTKIKTIVAKYVLLDREVKAIFRFSKTQKFKDIVDAIDSIDAVRELYNYLDDAGLNIYQIVNDGRSLIGLPPVDRNTFLNFKVFATNGLAGLIDEIMWALPNGELYELHERKMANDPAYKHLMTQMRSVEHQEIFQTLFNHEDFHHNVRQLKEGGFDVKPIIDLISGALEVEFPGTFLASTYKLSDDFYDFINLIPFEEIYNIAFAYVSTDDEVKEAVQYVMSDQFEELLVKLQNDHEVYKFLKNFHDRGVPIFEVINLVNDFLEVPPYPDHSKALRYERKGKGLQGMLQEIRAILPHNEIKALVEQKLVESTEFAYLAAYIKSPEFQAEIDIMVINKNVLELAHQAQLHGVSIEHIAQFLADLFGLEFPPPPWFPPMIRTLQKNDLTADLAEFIELLPFETLVETVFDYVAHDPEVYSAFMYVKSEPFQNIIKLVNQIPEYKDMLNELETIGLDANFWIEIIHELIDTDIDSDADSSKIEKPGITGLIESIRALIPYSDIKNLYHEKYENSEAFFKFINLIGSEKFQTLTNTLFENKDFQKLLHEAQAHGVNLKVISEFFFEIFGITTPPGVIEYYLKNSIKILM